MKNYINILKKINFISIIKLMVKNIQEYVVENIIKHIEELKEIKNVLSEFGIIKCNRCNKYTDKYITDCDFCLEKCCNSCIKNYTDWNISGIYVCEKCVFIWCVWCEKIKKECVCNK